MKNSIKFFLVAVFSVWAGNSSYGQGLAVNATGAVANTSAILDAASTSQGVLVPRMTTAQRNAISAPATGLMIYQTDGAAGFYYYSGAAWTAVSSPAGIAGGDLTGSYPSPTVASGAITGTKIAANTITTVNLPAGATSSTFLRGDNTWATPSGGGSTFSFISTSTTLANTTAKYIANAASVITLPASPSTNTDIYIIGSAYNIQINTNGKTVLDPTGWTGHGFMFTISAGTYNLSETAATLGNAYFAGAARFIYDGAKWIFVAF